jgi:hypothetical protein
MHTLDFMLFPKWPAYTVSVPWLHLHEKIFAAVVYLSEWCCYFMKISNH